MKTHYLFFNLIVIPLPFPKAMGALARAGVSEGHFANGTFAAPQSLVTPTTLTGFQYVIDQALDKDTPLIIAVNSNKSMSLIMDKKGETEQAKSLIEDQTTRAEKVAVPLALQNPDRNIVVLFYDEETPNALYNNLKESGFSMKSLFKWGYGTDPDAGIIEGAEDFGKVFAFPLPGDAKPLCANITRKTGQKGDVTVVDLRRAKGPHGKPYISPENECLFRLHYPELAVYGPRNDPKPSGLGPSFGPG